VTADLTALGNPSDAVTVITPVFRQAVYLPRCVTSVAWQLRVQDRAIIVEDEPVQPFQFSGTSPGRIDWFGNPKKVGVSQARNQGILNATTEWIKFLDADDVLAPFALDALRARIDAISEEVQVVTGGIHRIINGRYADYLNGARESLDHILNYNPILPSATFVRRSALLEVGMFDERIDFEEDWDLWLRIHERFGKQAFHIIDQPIAYYWICDAEQREKDRRGMVNGMTVRDYFRKRYGADPH